MTTLPLDRTFQILLVDDNLGDVMLAQKAMSRTRFKKTIHVAMDGAEALDFLHHRGTHVDAPRPDLILLDINLPKMSGHEVLNDVKRDSVLKCIPVIMLTSSARPSDIRAAYDNHANSYLTKPTTQSELVDTFKIVEDYWFNAVRLPEDGTS